jgi:hypothetical protein
MTPLMNIDDLLFNRDDVAYYANITLGGALFSALIDTGRCASEV